MHQFELCELCFQGEALIGSWAQVDFSAALTAPDGSVTTVPGFYAGDGQYRVRFYAKQAGTYRYRLQGVLSDDGSAEVLPALPGRHGMVRPVSMHFEHDDGTQFYPFGTTVYALAHQEDALVEQTLDTLAHNPFNKVRMCVFPKDYHYNKNEPPFYAFERTPEGGWDTSRPCLAFWDRFEDILRRLDGLGVQVDLILFHPYDRWGFSSLPQEDNLHYLDYLLRRLSAFPNLWWSLANEYDLNLNSKTMEHWEALEEFVAAYDPWKHLFSVHNCFKPWDYARPAVTHVSLQSKVLTLLPQYRKTYRKPVILDECCYEGNLEEFWGSISGKEMTARFWKAFASGAWCTHGETYLDPDCADPDSAVVWWAKGGRLVGESPRQIAFLRGIAEEIKGDIEPIPGMLEGMPREPEAMQAMIDGAPPRFRGFLQAISRMDAPFRENFEASEHVWRGHAGEDAYIVFYDSRTCATDTLDLPEGNRYRVELIRVWDLTREILLDHAGGKTRLRLPGEPGCAVIAWKE